MTTANATYLVLAADEVAVGHCVIISHGDNPYGKLLAVVVEVTPERVTARYLCRDTILKTCFTDWPHVVTPVGHFGLEVRHDGKEFWCQPIGESTATYDDGKRRKWQEHGVGKWRLRHTALNVAKLDARDSQ